MYLHVHSHNYANLSYNLVLLVSDCPTGQGRCSDTTTECVPLADFCDGITDCANGIDEQGCDFIIGCLNDGVRVDGDINTCDCGVRYAGERCETDLGGCCEI